MEQIEKFVVAFRKELRLLILSGAASNGALAGLCAVSATDVSSYLDRYVSARFRKLEQEFEVEVVGVRFLKDTNECFYTIKHGDVSAENKIV